MRDRIEAARTSRGYRSGAIAKGKAEHQMVSLSNEFQENPGFEIQNIGKRI